MKDYAKYENHKRGVRNVKTGEYRSGWKVHDKEGYEISKPMKAAKHKALEEVKQKKPWIRHGVSTRYDFHPSSLGSKKGHSYSVYYSDRTKGKTTERGYPNYVSALFKKKHEARDDAGKHKRGESTTTYGSAE